MTENKTWLGYVHANASDTCSHERQLAVVRRFLAERGYPEPQIFADLAMSSKGARPALDALIRESQRVSGAAVVVLDPSCLGSDISNLQRTRALLDTGAAIHFVKPPLVMSSGHLAELLFAELGSKRPRKRVSKTAPRSASRQPSKADR